jgi:hypothetical protein
VLLVPEEAIDHGEEAPDQSFLHSRPLAGRILSRRASQERLPVDHINLTWKAPEEASGRIKQFDDALAPTMRDRGLVWEFHIDETPRNLWLIEGFPPPPSGSEAEKRWLHENKPSAYATKAVDR